MVNKVDHLAVITVQISDTPSTRAHARDLARVYSMITVLFAVISPDSGNNPLRLSASLLP